MCERKKYLASVNHFSTHFDLCRILYRSYGWGNRKESSFSNFGSLLSRKSLPDWCRWWTEPVLRVCRLVRCRRTVSHRNRDSGRYFCLQSLVNPRSLQQHSTARHAPWRYCQELEIIWLQTSSWQNLDCGPRTCLALTVASRGCHTVHRCTGGSRGGGLGGLNPSPKDYPEKMLQIDYRCCK